MLLMWRLIEATVTPNKAAIAFCVAQIVSSLSTTLTFTSSVGVFAALVKVEKRDLFAKLPNRIQPTVESKNGQLSNQNLIEILDIQVKN